MLGFPDHLRMAGRGLTSRFGIGQSRGYLIILIHLGLVAVFGVFLPWTKGLDFLDPVITAAYACLGILFASPAAAQSFAEEPPRSMMDATARIVTAVLYGEGMAAAILLAGFMTVYATHSRVRLAPDIETLATASALGVSASFALAAIGAWATLKFSARTARSALRLIFLLLLVLFYFRSGWLPVVAGESALLCLIVFGAAILALRRELQ
jgi:hypothetical protein